MLVALLGNDQTFWLLRQGDIRAGNNNEKGWNKTGIYWNEKYEGQQLVKVTGLFHTWRRR